MKSIEQIIAMDEVDLNRVCRLEVKITRARLDKRTRYRGVCCIWWGVDCVAEIWTKKTWSTKNKATRQAKIVFQVLRHADWPMEIVDDIEERIALLDAKGF